MKPIFKDPHLQEHYRSKGYVLIDFLNQTQVEELKQFYGTLNNDHIPPYGFHVSINNENSSFVNSVMSKIKTVVQPATDQLFSNYRISTSSFAVKEPNTMSLVPPHQDWTFTNEEDGYCTATVWIALVETNIMNGAMGVIEGSHKFFNYPRASPPPQFRTPLDNHLFDIFPYLKLLPMKPGQALVFDNRTFHASPPNTTEKVRLAAAFVVTQADAPQVHYYLKPGSDEKKLVKYNVTDSFFTSYSNNKLSQLYLSGNYPEGLEFIAEVDNEAKFEISSQELTEKILAEGNELNTELCDHLAKLFNYSTEDNERIEASEQSEIVTSPEQTCEVDTTDIIAEVVLKEQEEVSMEIQTNDLPQKPNRSFFEVYTPINIFNEIKHRILSK